MKQGQTDFRRYAVFIVLSSLLVITVLSAVPRGLADLYYYPVKQYLGEPGSHPAPGSIRLERADHLVRRAHKLDRKNPDIARALALVLHEQAQNRYFWQPIEKGLARDGADVLRKAISIRPSSSWHWADLALLKANLGELDHEMLAAMQQASATGPWQPLVQLQLAAIGLTLWSRLPESARFNVRENIERAMIRKSQYVIEVAKARNRLPLLCELFKNHPKIMHMC